METNDVIKQIKDSHPMGWGGIAFGYPIKNIFSTGAFLISAILSLIVYFCSWLTVDKYSAHLTMLSDINLSVFPNLLGFNLGGYAIIVGFSSIDLVKKMLRPQKEKPYSFFQQTSSIFAFSIIVQAIVLILSFFVTLIARVNPVNPLNMFSFLTEFLYLFSNALFPALLFLSIYAVVLIPYIVLNVFTFGQMHHAFLIIQRQKEDEKNENEKTGQL